MKATTSVLSRPAHPFIWSAPQSARDGRSRYLMVAVLVHGLAVWLALSNTGSRVGQAARPTAVLLPRLPDPEPPAARPPEPPKPRAATPLESMTPNQVPEPELAPAASAAAPVVTSLPGSIPDVPLVPGTAATQPPAPSPRGFGAITNRADCAQAFNQSYPREARRSAQQGTVSLQVRVSATGDVQAAEVIGAQPRRVFERAALDVILSGACRFESDRAGYVAVLEVSYRLSGGAAD